MLKRTLLVLAASIIIVLAGTSLYYGGRFLNEKRLKRVELLRSDLSLSGQLQLLILGPSRENVSLVISEIAATGDYRLAAYIGELFHSNDWPVLVTDAALLNGDTGEALYYLPQIENSTLRTELANIISFSTGGEYVQNSNPATISGRLMLYVTAGEGDLGTVPEVVDRLAAKNVRKNDLQLALNLKGAHLPAFALALLERSEYPCNKAVNQTEVELLESVRGQDEAIDFIEVALVCDPNDLYLVKASVRLLSLKGDVDKANLYQKRLNLLSRLR